MHRYREGAGRAPPVGGSAMTRILAYGLCRALELLVGFASIQSAIAISRWILG
jgi:hypothetical protein